VTDLEQIDKPVMDGLVFIGDAYQTSCPAAGTGIGRSLNDVESLCGYLPEWLSSPGMAAEKVARFYADPKKQAADKAAAQTAEYRRALMTERSIGWTFHRRLLQIRQRIGGLVGGPKRIAMGLRPLGAGKMGHAVMPIAGRAQALGIVDPNEPALNG
jgi:2-polyprenyl-6-methoxyphenol hydroxylase-like FAD-dependent oxidoreductase